MGRTGQIVIALGAWGAERIGVFDEPCPLLWIKLLRLVWRKTIPNARIDLGHLWLLDHFDLGCTFLGCGRVRQDGGRGRVQGERGQ